MTDPVFLVAARRSGTTLLRLMLDGHPDLAWERGWEVVSDAIGASGEPPSAEQLRDLRTELGLDARTEIPSTSGSDGFHPIRDLVHASMAHHLEDKQKTRFGATVHVNSDRLFYLFPNAKFIHLVRDPRDIAISVEKLGWESTAWHAAQYWLKAEWEWRVLEKRLPPENWIDIRYEDLVSETEAVLTKICEFIGIPFSQKLFDYTETSPYGMPDASLVERWRGKMSPRDAALVEARTGDKMLPYGYEPSEPSRMPGTLETMLLDLQNSVTQRTRRLKLEGFVTFGLGVLYNRFHVTSLEEALEKRRGEKRVQRIAELEANYGRVAAPSAAGDSHGQSSES